VCLQERKAVSKQGLNIKRLLGSEVSSETWDKVRGGWHCRLQYAYSNSHL
jgi:predicted N-acyltransferase